MITILKTSDGKCLTKTFRQSPDGEWLKTDYDSAYRFDAETADDITSIYDLSDLLMALEGCDDTCVIRGLTTGGTKNIRRTLYAAEDGSPATIKPNPAGVPWLMIDFDKLPVASLNLTTNEERLAYLVGQLPPEFHGATYHYQWSSSAGLKGWDLLSCHLFFWLTKPWGCKTLHDRFYSGDFAGCGADAAPFTPNQVHYTAAPIFKDCADPLDGIRSGLVKGDRDAVTLTPWSPPVYVPPAISAVMHHRLRPNERFGELLLEIGPDYHAPIRKAVAHYFYVTPADQVDVAWLKGELKSAIHQARPGKNPKKDYLDDRYLDRLIKGANRKFSGTNAATNSTGDVRNLLKLKMKAMKNVRR